MAASAGSTDIVKLLIERKRFRPMVIPVGEYRDLTTFCLKKKPLLLALDNGSLGSLRLLRRMDLLDKLVWYPALKKALVSNKPPPLLPFLEMGLHNGLGDEMTWTPLQSAVKWGLVEPLRLILGYGVSVDEKGKFGETALQESCKRPGRHAITAMLLEAGSDAGVTTAYGQTPLQPAMCRGDAELVRMLLARARPKMQIMCWAPVRARKDRGRMAESGV